MKLAYGTTRLVILIGSYAIKFPRIPIIRTFQRLIYHSKRQQVRKKIYQYHSNPAVAVLKHLFSGVLANSIEYRVWNETRSFYLVPTLFSFYGIVNIQKRGRGISQRQLNDRHPFPHLLKEEDVDNYVNMISAENFCLIDDRLLLIDYGREDTAGMFTQKSLPTKIPLLRTAQLT